MKRFALVIPMLLLVGCTEETKLEKEDTQKQEVVQQEQQDVVETPTDEQVYGEEEEATEPLQVEQADVTTEAGKHYVDVVTQMSTANMTSYTAQVAATEEMQWEEMGHMMTQMVTLGATVTAQNGDVQKRLMTGDYIQETNDLRENEKIIAYEEIGEEYAAYFNEGPTWYRTDPTTMKEQIAVGFYIESIDMLLSYFEQNADKLKTASETPELVTYTLTLTKDEMEPIVKKLMHKDDYTVLAPFEKIDNTIMFKISKGDKPLLQQLTITLNAKASTGVLKHESSMTFAKINEPVTITAPAGIDSAEVFQVY